MNIAINGFGRIGRATLKALLGTKNSLKVVAINDLALPSELAHLFKYDSVYGQYLANIRSTSKVIYISGKKIPVFNQRDPNNLPWDKLGVDIVIESTGFFRTIESASAHIKAGAKKVIISAPARDEVKTVVLGVNENKLRKSDKIVSMASCTTNCLAPVTAIIDKALGVRKAIMTTVHSYTADQNLVDGSHRDMRRARAASLNMIPTSTGAVIATTKAIPKLERKFDGLSIRVPTPVVSVVDVVYVVKKKTTTDKLNQIIARATGTKKYKGIVDISEEDLVSSDFIGHRASAIVDTPMNRVVDGDLVKIIAWYDNEFGYASRLVDVCNYIKSKKLI